MANEIVHFDISGPNLEPLAEFYGQLFGWKIQNQGSGYAQLESAGGLRGAAVESEAAGVNLGVQVDDLANAVQQVEALGGKIEMPPTDNGWVFKAQVRDPAGNLLSLIQSGDKPNT